MAANGIRPLRIDVSLVARGTAATLRSNLVTRPTGRAVRKAIESRLTDSGVVSVSLLDFTGIRVLDFSCADEVVAKLLLRHLGPDRPRDAFFLFRAVGDLHRHALEEVLHRHKLAAVCDVEGGRFRLLGRTRRDKQEAWSDLERRRRIDPARAGSAPGPAGTRQLRRLAERRLAYLDGAGVVSSLTTLAVTGTACGQ